MLELCMVKAFTSVRAVARAMSMQAMSKLESTRASMLCFYAVLLAAGCSTMKRLLSCQRIRGWLDLQGENIHMHIYMCIFIYLYIHTGC